MNTELLARRKVKHERALRRAKNEKERSKAQRELQELVPHIIRLTFEEKLAYNKEVRRLLAKKLGIPKKGARK
ncbi:hypothetical protein EXIGUO8H_20355 [Exiguobacterium sp. 8H]|uniref:hypothetical protein n=1 Tax=unclassified Exiguobacterium TaxID=2644629 RepID=UPI0012F05A55|nr:MULTISPECIES: hypothetical protein [unclassified Exiguobacterium]VXB52365.1 hypothetical protein EXIGUO8A_11424 [Exiguobacterium sp. 8A]VXB53059.1 hypothetical protein EXIGUO8H_20355 [Exiguobacterium sp. 8H]